VRAGLHTGECEVREDDIGGIAVHIGARVSALAGPNDVLVSRTLRDRSNNAAGFARPWAGVTLLGGSNLRGSGDGEDGARDQLGIVNRRSVREAGQDGESRAGYAVAGDGFAHLDWENLCRFRPRRW
jgi:hypothetical protein